MMNKIYLFVLLLTFAAASTVSAQTNYLIILDDARLDVGVEMVSVFALDDRAPLSSNPHFEAMWNLVKLGASLEALLNGSDEPVNDLNMERTFGQNGYNRSVFKFFVRYGFGESSDVKIQRQFLELGASQGYFREGNGGMNIHLDYRFNVMTTPYGAGGQSIAKAIDYEIFVGARTGFDWSFQRSESEAGFFTHLSDEIERIADENEFTASQLIMLEDFAENSKVLLPEDVGGRAFHVGPVAGFKLSKTFVKNAQFFFQGQGFYDLMDLTNRKGAANVRSQHHILLMLGLSYAIGGEGKRTPSSFF
jgi:opacity protein-like surface antigen